MATEDTELPDLTAATVLDGTESYYLVQASNSRKDTIAGRLKTYLDTLYMAGTVVADRTVLKALATASVTTAYLEEAGRQGVFVWKTGDYSTQVTADTQEGVYIKADDTATTSGAWVRVHGGIVLPSWYGIVLDGNGNYSTALGEMLTRAVEEGLVVQWPAGIARCTASVTVTPSAAAKSLRIEGISPTASRIRFVGDTKLLFNGGTPSYDATSQFFASKMGFQRAGAGASTPILHLSWSSGSGTTAFTGAMDDCHFESVTNSETFESGCKFTNARQFQTNHCRVKGKRTGTTLDCLYGWHLEGTSDPVEMSFRDCTEVFVRTGMYVEPTAQIEGLEVQGGDTVACSVGLSYLRSSASAEPWLKVIGKHFNCSLKGITFKNINQPLIHGNLIYAQSSIQSADLTGDWIGIEMNDDFALIPKIGGFITHNQIHRFATYSGTTYGIKVVSTRGDLDTTIKDNHINDFTVGTSRGSNITGIDFTDNYYRNCTTNHSHSPTTQSATIVSGAITIEGRYIRRILLTGESAPDDFNTLSGGTQQMVGNLVTLQNGTAILITVKDSTGNLQLEGDFALSSAQDTLTVRWNGANWQEIARSNNA